MPLRSLYRAVSAPLAWRLPGHAARMLFGFAQAERGSMLDLMVAANLTTSPERRALYVRHALDEARHAAVFARRSAELRADEGRPALGPVVADSEHLFERLGETRFVAFVHLGEGRGRADFEAHVRACRGTGDARSAAVFEAVLVDEARHETYTGEVLRDLAGGQRGARRELLRARGWDAWRSFRRVGRGIAARLHAASMVVLYLMAAPLAILVRVARPERSGWVGPRLDVGRSDGRAA